MKIKNFSKNISFKTKLFLGMGSIFLALALIVCFLFSKNAIHTTVESDRSSSEIILERISTQIDSLYEQMNIAATSITKNPALRSIILELNTSEASPSRQYLYRLQQERDIRTALGNMMFSSIISNVHLYNKDKQYFYYSGNYYNDLGYIYQTLSNDDTADRLFGKNVIYFPPAANRWTRENRQVISVVRNFADTATTQDTVVEIQVKASLLDDICTQKSFQNEKQILILNKDNEIVYSPQKENVLSDETISTICKKIQNGRSSHWEFDYSYSTMSKGSTGFTTVLISNNHTVRQQTLLYFVTTLISVLLVLIVTLGITYKLITHVTKPLKQLISHIDELRLDSDTKFLLPTGSFDEFEILNTSLNQMVAKLKDSITEIYELQIRESNANLAALQAQVDPHFLYNALNSISAASEIYDSEVTTRMCQDLSSMMRYVTSKNMSVSLIEEISHTKNFLDFMKFSNDTNFDYTIVVPQELHSLKVPKLSIQPFAENSFSHGFKNTMPPWYLSIICSAKEDIWTIRIEDNGGGFTKEALSHIASAPVHAVDIEINGLGLNNTFSRLSLFFGEDFSYHIENLSQGSRITLKGRL